MVSNIQKAAIYCVKHGHAAYGYGCFGYVYCGRCGEQVGDRLGSIFPQAERFADVACKTKKCKYCEAVIKSLTARDRKIYARLKEMELPDAEKAIKGIKF
ncbi:MAG: hypothetical protein PHS46_08235 [Candidatus Omnitrophica bacterium]|nr:hypothetical protein [Candidatus Omnitrophota bacterium]